MREVNSEFKTKVRKISAAKKVHFSCNQTSVENVNLLIRKGVIIGNGCFGMVTSVKVKWGDKEKWKKFANKIILVRNKNVYCKELDIMKQLDHQNIAKLHFYFFSYCEKSEKREHHLNLIMERMSTTLYRELRQNGPFKEWKALKLYQQLIQALTYTHDKSICHRDLKPSNLLLNQNNSILKLCDFGSAKVLNNSIDNISSAYICSRYYRAPELILGSQTYGLEVDIWSSACILAEMILAEPLFQGETNMSQLVEIIFVLGPIEAPEMSSLEDHQVLSRFGGSKEEKLREKFGSCQVSDFVINLFLHQLQYDPKQRPHALAISQDLLSCV